MEHRTPMMEQLFSVPGLMKDMSASLFLEAKQAANVIIQGGFDKIILTGCGDSYCAAMAARYPFMEYTGLRVEVAPVIELSRYYGRRQLDDRTVVVIISNSGTVARCIELAKKAGAMGSFVLAVTGNELGGLYQNASAAIRLSIPRFAYAPGIRSYCGCLLALFSLALELGAGGKQLSEGRAQQIKEELKGIPMLLEACLEQWESQALTLAKAYKDCTSYELIGSGYGYASALFGYAKALETTGKPAAALNTEDWLHTNYFVRDVYHTGTILFTNREQEDQSRAMELCRVAADMGRPLICVTNDGTLYQSCMLTPVLKESLLYPLVQYLPVSMLFSCLGEALGEVYFRDGKENWTACINCATLIESKIMVS